MGSYVGGLSGTHLPKTYLGPPPQVLNHQPFDFPMVSVEGCYHYNTLPPDHEDVAVSLPSSCYGKEESRFHLCALLVTQV